MLMFWKYLLLKRTLILLGILLVLPFFAMLFCHALVNVDAPLWWDPISESQFSGGYWDDEGVEFFWIMKISMLAAIVLNAVFLLVIPPAFGGMDPAVKRGQFWLGLIVNSIAGTGLSLFYFFMYGLDNLTMWAALFPLHIVAFSVTFIIGSRFVSPAYIKRFWF